MSKRVKAIILLLSLMGCSIFAERVCYAAWQTNPKNQSKLTVFLRVEDGKLAVDRVKSATGFVASPEFKSRLLMSEDAAKKILLDDMDSAFKQMRKVYQYALDESEMEQEPTDELTKKIGSHSYGNWGEFKTDFDAWVAAGTSAGKQRTDLATLLTPSNMLKDLSSLNTSSALIFIGNTARPRPYNPEVGSLTLRVADPIGDVSNEEELKIEFVRQNSQIATIASDRDIRNLLKKLRGRLWRSGDLTASIEDFYADRGLQATVRVTPAGDSEKKITIMESPRIATVLLHKDVPESDYNKILYYLLPERQFRVFLKNRPLQKIPADGELIYRGVDYCNLKSKPDDSLPCPEPYLNQMMFQIQQLQLSQLGYVASQTMSGDRPGATSESYINIVVNKAEESDKAKGERPENAPQPAPLVPNAEGVAHPNADGANNPASFTPPSPNVNTETRLAEGTDDNTTGSTEKTWTPKERNNYVGFGFEYKPGQGVRYFSIYQRSKLFGDSDQSSLSVKAGGQGEGLGAINFFSDFVLFNLLHRRASVQLTTSSDFESSRVFNGEKTDERRTGGLARVEMELFRDLSGSLLRFYLEGRHMTVDLNRQDKTVAKQNLNTLDLGGLFTFSNTEATRPRRLRLEPRVRFGLGLSSSEQNFATFLLTGNYHTQLPRLFEADFNAHLEAASSKTPIFELPSFGTEETVRGFRKDDALGRRLWSLQNELWAPVPKTSQAVEGVGRFLRQKVRLAGFLDVGGIYQTTDSKSGIRLGPGLGVRIIYFPVIIKGDWAYGIGDAVTGRGHGRFYLSIATNLPF